MLVLYGVIPTFQPGGASFARVYAVYVSCGFHEQWRCLLVIVAYLLTLIATKWNKCSAALIFHGFCRGVSS